MISFSTDTTSTRGDIVIAYGDGKLGKTTFASGAPDAVLLSCEGGEEQLIKRGAAKLTRIRVREDKADPYIPRDWKTALSAVESYKDAKTRPGRWLIIDGATRLWEMCHAEIWGKMQPKDRGFGKGERAVFDEFKKLCIAVDIIASQGVGVIITCHAMLAKDPMPSHAVEDPKMLLPAFQVYPNADMSRYIFGMADVVLFFMREATVATVSDNKHVAVGSGRVIVRTQKGHGYLAGGRYPEVDDPIELSTDPKESWGKFWSQTVETKAGVRADIETLLPKCPGDKRQTAEQTYKEADSFAKLIAIRNRLKEVTS